MTVGSGLVRTAGAAEVLLGVLLAVGLFRRPVAWLALALNTASTMASWRQILDPWGRLGLGPGGTHLFLASVVLHAVSVVLVLNAHDATFTFDGRLQRVRAPARTHASALASVDGTSGPLRRETTPRRGRSVRP